ncbi:MAG: hypothetical protein WCG91_00060 [Candidatus Shapirobacteria bacterium]
MIKFLKNVTKKLDFWDVGFIKLAVAAFILASIVLCPPFAAWVQSVDPVYFIIAFIIFAIRPIYRIWFKK